MRKLPAYLKAVAGALTAGGTALYTGLENGSMSQGDWILFAVAVIGSFGIVYNVPNSPPNPPA